MGTDPDIAADVAFAACPEGERIQPWSEFVRIEVRTVRELSGAARRVLNVYAQPGFVLHDAHQFHDGAWVELLYKETNSQGGVQ
jgi:hypothetical protein